MKPTADEIRAWIEENIPAFHQRRLESLSRLQLVKLLRRKNPYLFRAKNIATAEELVRGLLSAHLSSQEETLFGGFLEKLALFINQKAFGGRKSSAEGIDLEFERGGTRYFVSIKSGPNWGNSSQIQKLRDAFRRASKVIRQNDPSVSLCFVNGCCYGRDPNPDKGDYLKLCGQKFWELISGRENLYVEIIEPLGYKARDRNEEFTEKFSACVNLFTREFYDIFCDSSGRILWEKFIEFTSRAGK